MNKFKEPIVAAIIVILLILLSSKLEAQEMYLCKLSTNDVGDFISTGTNYQDAMLKTTNACLDARIALFFKIRGVNPELDQMTLFMEDCLNRNVCKKGKLK
jgi:hypothetical protein